MTSSSAAGDASAEEQARSRKPYAAPTLIRWGTVEDLTGAGTGGAVEGLGTGSGGGG
jgi:hypothetical protein